MSALIDWDRLPTETPKSYAAFLALGARRSVREAARQHHVKTMSSGPEVTTVKHWLRWSDRHKWVSRSLARDEWIARTSDDQIVSNVTACKLALTTRAHDCLTARRRAARAGNVDQLHRRRRLRHRAVYFHGRLLPDHRVRPDRDHEQLHPHGALSGLNDLDIFSFDDVLPLAVTAGKTDPDDIPETPKNPVSRVGDIWTLGKHRLMCGDATKPEHRLRHRDRARLR